MPMLFVTQVTLSQYSFLYSYLCHHFILVIMPLYSMFICYLDSLGTEPLCSPHSVNIDFVSIARLVHIDGVLNVMDAVMVLMYG